MKISALIFSMNRIENVISLVNKIKDFVDEVVIVDSSQRKNFEILKRKLKFAKVYWLPPIGVVELYHQIGINLCSNDWILYFDDDEEPTIELLQEIIKLKNEGKEPSAKVFLIKRIEKNGFSMLCRFFNRKYIEPTGLIHWGFEIRTTNISKLPGYIIHKNEEGDYSKFIRKLQRYAIIEAYQWWYKVEYSINTSNKIIAKFLRMLLIRIPFPLFAWICANAFLIYYFILWIRSKCCSIFVSSLYCLFILFYINKNFKKCIKIWESISGKNTYPIKHLGLNSIENIRRKILHPEDGLKNFIKLMENIK